MTTTYFFFFLPLSFACIVYDNTFFNKISKSIILKGKNEIKGGREEGGEEAFRYENMTQVGR